MNTDNFQQVGKCSCCKDFMTLDEFPTHECSTISDIPIKEVKEISIEHFYETKSKGKSILMVKGLDGTFYRMVCRNREFIPISLSDDSYHEPQNRRRVTRTQFRVL